MAPFLLLQAFQFIDSNKDGIIDKNDLRATFDALGLYIYFIMYRLNTINVTFSQKTGRLYPDSELQSMLSEAPGPLNFTMFLSIFGERIAGRLLEIFRLLVSD